MLVIIGASATGKSEVVKRLKDLYNINKFITCTTREKRINEEDGIDYYFFSKEQFLNKINHDEFIEYQEYNNNLYGSLKSEIAPNKVVILEPKGFYEYKNKGIDCFSVYLNTSTFTRFIRMLKRKDGIKKAKERIKNDKDVFNKQLEQDVDLVISKKMSPEELAKTIYDKYKECFLCKK